jgi:hypothetical protein
VVTKHKEKGKKERTGRSAMRAVGTPTAVFENEIKQKKKRPKMTHRPQLLSQQVENLQNVEQNDVAS